MGTLQIVPMERQHLEAVAALEQQCFSRPWSPESLASELDNRDSVMLAALMDGAVAGYVGMRYVLDEGFINNVAVSGDFRRRKIASALLEGLIAWAVHLNMRTITLEVRASNTAATALYAKYGFQRVGLRKHYYTSPVEDAVLMTLELTEGSFHDGVQQY